MFIKYIKIKYSIKSALVVMTFSRQPRNFLSQHVRKHLHDLCDQGLLCVVGGFINIPFNNVQDILVERVAVWAARGPNHLFSGASGGSGAFVSSPTVIILSPPT